MLSATKLFLLVIRAFVTNSKIDQTVRDQFTPEMIEALFGIAKAHDVTQIVSDVLFKNQLLVKGTPIAEMYQKSQITALRRYMNIEHEQQRLYKLFEDNAIAFIPLKGAVSRQYYPEPYMRTSCDVDILVHEEDLQKAVQLLMTTLNYRSNEIVGYHDVSLYSPTGVHLELHYNLKEKRANLDRVLVNVWDHSVDTENGAYYKLQSPEFFLFHHMAHMVNHFLRGGCGIRPFIDLYFMEKQVKYNVDVRDALMKQAEIDVFYRSALQCLDVWFNNGAATETVDLIESYILNGGVYGNRENRINVDQNKKGGKRKYILSRLFLPYDVLKYRYPILKKHKILLPFIWVIRLFTFISPKKRKRAQRDLEIHNAISGNAEKTTDKMLKLLQI